MAKDPMQDIRTRFLHAMHMVQQKHKDVRSVKAFAKAIKAPYISIHRIDKEMAYPTAGNIHYLCKNFGFDAHDIIMGANKKKEINERLRDLEQNIREIKKQLIKRPR